MARMGRMGLGSSVCHCPVKLHFGSVLRSPWSSTRLLCFSLQIGGATKVGGHQLRPTFHVPSPSCPSYSPAHTVILSESRNELTVGVRCWYHKPSLEGPGAG